MACYADVLDGYERWHSSSYRQKAIDEIYEHVCADDKASHCISIGPVCVSLAPRSSHDFHLLFHIALRWLHTHTHSHPFNGPLSRTTRVSRYQKGITNLDFTEARDSEWQWHQLGHMQVCTALETDNHASTSPLSFYRPDALPAAQPTASKHWRHHYQDNYSCSNVRGRWKCFEPVCFLVYVCEENVTGRIFGFLLVFYKNFISSAYLLLWDLIYLKKLVDITTDFLNLLSYSYRIFDTEEHSVIQPQQVHNGMAVVYSEYAKSYATVNCWAAEFHWDRRSLEDELQSVCPCE